jgi:hypothetical protein
VPKLFHNVTPYRGNHWLELNLVGTVDSRDSCGARVIATIGHTKLLREVTCGSTSFASWNDPTVHYGLGRHQTVSKVEIVWPSGRKRTLLDVRPDRVLRLIEPRQ